MQTSIDFSGPESWRVRDVRRYSASDESLEALKARTTPLDSTNPFVTTHASCAQAFLATAISQQDRVGELRLQHEAHSARLSDVTLLQPTQMSTTFVDTAPLPVALTPQTEPPIFSEPELRSVLTSPILSYAQPESALVLPVQQHTNDAATSQVYKEERALPLSGFVKAEVKLDEDEVQLLEFDDKSGTAQFSGTAPVGILVQFYIDDVLVGSAEADDVGHWQFAAPSQLSAAEHTFSSVIADANGVVKSKIDFAFIHPPQPEMIILPVDDMMDIDNALIELALAPEETIPTIMPLVLTDDMLATEQILGGISLQPLDFVAFDELENSYIIWH